jgi:hypothetical protein
MNEADVEIMKHDVRVSHCLEPDIFICVMMDTLQSVWNNFFLNKTVPYFLFNKS